MTRASVDYVLPTATPALRAERTLEENLETLTRVLIRRYDMYDCAHGNFPSSKAADIASVFDNQKGAAALSLLEPELARFDTLYMRERGVYTLALSGSSVALAFGGLIAFAGTASDHLGVGALAAGSGAAVLGVIYKLGGRDEKEANRLQNEIWTRAKQAMGMVSTDFGLPQ